MDGPLVLEGAAEVDAPGDELDEAEPDVDEALDEPDPPDVVDGAAELPEDPDPAAELSLPPPGTVTTVPGAPLDAVGLAVTVSNTVLRSAAPELQPVTSNAAAAVSATGTRKRRAVAEGVLG